MAEMWDEADVALERKVKGTLANPRMQKAQNKSVPVVQERSQEEIYILAQAAQATTPPNRPATGAAAEKHVWQ